MSLVALKCPNCGGQLEFEDSREFGFCQFCGFKVMIQQEINHIHVTQNFDTQIKRLEESINNCLAMKNPDDALKSINQLYNIDESNPIISISRAKAYMIRAQNRGQAPSIIEILAAKDEVKNYCRITGKTLSLDQIIEELGMDPLITIEDFKDMLKEGKGEIAFDAIMDSFANTSKEDIRINPGLYRIQLYENIITMLDTCFEVLGRFPSFLGKKHLGLPDAEYVLEVYVTPFINTVPRPLLPTGLYTIGPLSDGVRFSAYWDFEWFYLEKLQERKPNLVYELMKDNLIHHLSNPAETPEVAIDAIYQIVNRLTPYVHISAMVLETMLKLNLKAETLEAYPNWNRNGELADLIGKMEGQRAVSMTESEEAALKILNRDHALFHKTETKKGLFGTKEVAPPIRPSAIEAAKHGIKWDMFENNGNPDIEYFFKLGY